MVFRIGGFPEISHTERSSACLSFHTDFIIIVKSVSAMHWTLLQIITTAVALVALLLGVANFALARKAAGREAILRKRDDRLEVKQLLNTANSLLWGREGYEQTKDVAKQQEAEVIIRQALTIESGNPKAIEYEGDLFYVRGNKERAKDCYKRSISLEPTRASPYNRLALASKGEEAIKNYEKAVELDSDYAALPYTNLGQLYVSLSRLEEAENCFRNAIALWPEYSRAHHKLGDILRKRGEYKGARKEYEHAIKADANNLDPAVALGLMLMENLGNDKDGLAWIEDAMKKDPTDAYPYGMLAAIYADRKQPKKSLEYAAKAIAIDRNCTFQGKAIEFTRQEMEDLLRVDAPKDNA